MNWNRQAVHIILTTVKELMQISATQNKAKNSQEANFDDLMVS